MSKPIVKKEYNTNAIPYSCSPPFTKGLYALLIVFDLTALGVNKIGLLYCRSMFSAPFKFGQSNFGLRDN